MDIQEMGEGHGLEWSGSHYGQEAGSCERRNENPGSIKWAEFLISWLAEDLLASQAGLFSMQLVHLVIYYILRKIMPDMTPHEKTLSCYTMIIHHYGFGICLLHQ